MGLFQILPSTWSDFALKGFNNPYDIEQNIDVGMLNFPRTMNALAQNGMVAPTEEQLYLAHQQGGAGAAALSNTAGLKALGSG